VNGFVLEPAHLLLVVSSPFGDVDVKYRPETIAVMGALHFGCYLFLEGKSEEWLLVLRKADALRREL
jgi:hypothetical protein